MIWWNLAALEEVDTVDEIVVATDCDEIENVVNGFNLPKVKVYRRATTNAQDDSSTESVMLEYLEQSGLSDHTVFVLSQCTSPLTEAEHYAEALDTFRSREYDSLLSVVRSKRFFWNTDGTPLNYDYQNRPRRQDFDGMYMENGAFYISTVEAIQSSRNRLSGKIGFYEMPDYTAYELDEEMDWVILEGVKNNL